MSKLPTVRTATPVDIPRIVQLENERWSPAQRCSEQNFISRMQHFPAGFLVVEMGDQLLGSFYAIKRAFYQEGLLHWLSASGNGTGCTHDPSANALFSISVTVAKQAPPGIYRRLMEAWHELARQQKVKYIFAGSRLPGLQKFSGSAAEYVDAVVKGRLFDPILSKALSCGFQTAGLLPNYFDDPESRHFGVKIFDVL